MQFSHFSRFTSFFFSFYLWCALVSFISISPCPLGAFGLSQLSAAARPSPTAFQGYCTIALLTALRAPKAATAGKKRNCFRLSSPDLFSRVFCVQCTVALLHCNCTAACVAHFGFYTAFPAKKYVHLMWFYECFQANVS